MSLSVDIKYDIKWPKELLTKQTQCMVDTTGKTVVREIKRNIIDSRSIYGGSLKPLKPSTIARKRGLRSPSKALYRVGILHRAIHYYKRGMNAGFVSIIRRGSPNRRLVGIVQQTGVYRGGTPRPFFGISAKTRVALDWMWTGWFKRTMRHATAYQKGSVKAGR